MDNIELQEIDSFAEIKLDIKYPHVLIEGISTEEEVIYFNKKSNNSSKALPLYLKFENVYKCIGDIELTLDSLIGLRYISDYKISLCLSEGKTVPIDLNNAETYLQFITLD